ncbi:heterogeneous nuclear ribonucleoprotein U-like protein 2 isoform X6 [Astyanax mexicanus]|uniref:heterogeneous nuclear ribonucleoprotein U-like protein 2 isoform X6 n=1 Tax=Astyanax mexicanus TaxID=7994 RepID=UPI0020CAE4DE|nr:heterogeneous nuclear ribonucleoprotein U-like protein 2 isoform X6 [Astyanax mexicanus]
MSLEEVKKLKVVELRAKLRERGLESKGLKAELVARLLSAIEAGVGESSTGKKASIEEDNSPGEIVQIPRVTVSPALPALKAEGDGSCEVLRLEGHLPGPEESGHTTKREHHFDQSTQTENLPNFSHIPPCSCSSGRQGDKEAKQLGTEEHLKEKSVRANSQPLGKTSPIEIHPVGQEASLHSRTSSAGGPADAGRPSVAASATAPEGPTATECSAVHNNHKSTSSVPAASIKPMPHFSSTSQTCDDKQSSKSPGTEGRVTQKPVEEKGRDYYEFKEEVQYNRAKTPEPGPESEDEMEVDDDDVVRLDPYNSDLHFELGVDGCSGQPSLWEKFPLLRSGCRLTHGFTQGKVGFEVKFVKKLSAATVDLSFDPEPHVLRVGWSVEGSSLQLGEEELSFGFDAMGKAVTGGKAGGFGEPFSEGDVLGCYAFISDCGEAELLYYKNGRSLGEAFRISSSILAGRALYPHVLCKNCSIALNLDPEGVMWYPGPPDYCPLPVLPSAQRTRGPLPPPRRKDCEVLMMVGMPASGKSHWVQKHVAKNPEKHYNVLSTNSILHCMRLPGPQHKELLLQQATQCLTHLLRIAANKRRNFILDQANIYPSAQKHKMLLFHGHLRRAVVVVPSEAEWKRRLQQQLEEEGVQVPKLSLLKSKVSFTLPEQGQLLEEVLFVELCREEVQKLLTTYKEEAKRLLPAPPKRKRHQYRHNKLHMKSRSRAYGWSQSSQSQWGHQKQYGWHPSLFAQPYGRNSDPQRYRDYYQPYTGQWNTYDQTHGYYSNQDYYFGNQGFW